MNLITLTITFLIFSIMLVFSIGGLFNFLSNGYLIKFIRIKASRGKQVLVQEWGISNCKFFIGQIDENNTLNYKVNKKQKKISNLGKDDILRVYGLPVVNISSEKNSIIRIVDNQEIAGHDPIKVDSMIKQALMLGQMLDNKMFNILLIIVIIATIGILINIGLTYYMMDYLQNNINQIAMEVASHGTAII
jgi:hypothetical protein